MDTVRQSLVVLVGAVGAVTLAGVVYTGEGDFNPYRDSEEYRSGGGGYRPDGMSNSLSDQTRAHQRELERLDSEQTQRARQDYQQGQQQQQRRQQDYSSGSSNDTRGKDGR